MSQAPTFAFAPSLLPDGRMKFPAPAAAAPAAPAGPEYVAPDQLTPDELRQEVDLPGGGRVPLYRHLAAEQISRDKAAYATASATRPADGSGGLPDAPAPADDVFRQWEVLSGRPDPAVAHVKTLPKARYPLRGLDAELNTTGPAHSPIWGDVAGAGVGAIAGKVGLLAPGLGKDLSAGSAINNPDDKSWRSAVTRPLAGFALDAPMMLLGGAGTAAGFAAAGGAGAAGAARIEAAATREAGTPVSAGAEFGGALLRGAVGAGAGYAQARLMQGWAPALAAKLGGATAAGRFGVAGAIDVAGNVGANVVQQVADNALSPLTRPLARGESYGGRLGEELGQAAISGAVLGGVMAPVAGAQAVRVMRMETVANALGTPHVSEAAQPRSADGAAAHELATAATGHAPVWFHSASPRRAFYGEDGRLYVNARFPREAAEEAFHAVWRDPELGQGLRAFAEGNPDLVARSADNYAARAEAAGEAGLAERVREAGDARTDEGVANVGKLVMQDPEALAALAAMNPGLVSRWAARVGRALEMIGARPNGAARAALVRRRHAQFIDPLVRQAEAVRDRVEAEGAAHAAVAAERDAQLVPLVPPTRTAEDAGKTEDSAQLVPPAMPAAERQAAVHDAQGRLDRGELTPDQYFAEVRPHFEAAPREGWLPADRPLPPPRAEPAPADGSGADMRDGMRAPAPGVSGENALPPAAAVGKPTQSITDSITAAPADPPAAAGRTPQPPPAESPVPAQAPPPAAGGEGAGQRANSDQLAAAPPPPAPPAVTPAKAPAKPKGPAKPSTRISRAEMERRLMAAYEETDGAVHDDRLVQAEELEDRSGGGATIFRGAFPEDLVGRFTDEEWQQIRSRNLVRLARDGEHAGGEDAISEAGARGDDGAGMGIERYERMIRDRLEGSDAGRRRAARESAKTSGDPVAAFWATALDALDTPRADPRRAAKVRQVERAIRRGKVTEASGRRQIAKLEAQKAEKAVPFTTVAAEKLPPGSAFEFQGEKFRVVEDPESGLAILRDGDAYEEVPVGWLGQVPVDKGTLVKPGRREGKAEKKAAPAPPPADPDGPAEYTESDIPFSVGSGADDAEPRPRPAGLFGQTVYDPATGRQQELPFHTPAEVKRPASADPRDDRAARVNADDPGQGRMFSVGSGADDDVNAQGFYSQLRRTLAAKMPARASRDQVRQIALGGAKADEVKWSGLEEYLARHAGPVDKAEMMAWLRGNEVRVEEVTRGEPYFHRDPPAPEEVDRLVAARDAADAAFREAQDALAEPAEYDAAGAALAAADRALREARTPPPPPRFAQYEGYQLPAAPEGTYRELLLTLPVKGDAEFVVEQNKHGEWQLREPATGNAHILRAQTREAAEAEAAPIRARRHATVAGAYKSSHWEEPNVLAHVRFNERTDVDGQRVLLIEEVQSDWHQEGREKGYRQPVPAGDYLLLEADTDKAVGAADSPEDAKAWAVRTGGTWIPRDSKDGRAAVEAAESGVPQAPFAKTWHEFAMKRMIRYAAEHGYDRVAWTPGEQQAERYNLAKHVDRVIYNPADQYLVAQKGTRDVVEKFDVPPEKVPDFVGKEAARNLFAAPLNEKGQHVLAGDGLKVGGEGMKGFYDKILPDFVNRYAKRWGARVGQTTLAAPTEADPTQTFRVHAVDVTPAMKKGAMEEGQPMFSVGSGAEEGAGGPAKRRGKAAPAYDRNLVALHNTTAGGIMGATRLGGIPVPSIAVTRSDMPFAQYGEITLVGDRKMVDPANPQNQVYDADAYTQRMPGQRFKIDPAATRELVRGLKADKAIEPYSRVGDYSDSFDYIPDWLEQYNGIEEATKNARYSLPFMAKYAKDRGLALPDPPKRSGDHEADRQDRHRATDALRDAIRADGVEKFDTWVDRLFEPVKGDSYFVNSAGRKRPFTLDEVVAAMTKRRSAGKEKPLATGLGYARAFGAKRIKSVDEMHRYDFKPADELDAVTRPLQDRYFPIVDALAPYWRYEGSEMSKRFAQLDAGGQVIGHIIKGRRFTEQAARAALSREGFDGWKADAGAVADLAALARDVAAVPIDYLEAKPQRAVRLDDFRAAVVPDDADPAAVETLRARGLSIETYKRGDNASRRDAVDRVARATDRPDDPTMFSVGSGSPETALTGDAEDRFAAARGLPATPLRDKIKEGAGNLRKEMTRHFIHLDTAERDDAEAANVLRLREAAEQDAPHKARRTMEDFVRPLRGDPAAYKHFERMVILPDLIKEMEAGTYDKRPEAVPFYGGGGRPLSAALAAAKTDLARIEAAAPAKVKEAVGARNAEVRKLTERMVELGLLRPEVLDDARYFHRQVMAAMKLREQAAAGAPGELADARLREKGFQKDRVGGGEFNTAYEQAEHEYLTDAYRQLSAKESLDRIGARFDLTPALKEKHGDDWRDQVPEGYTVWTPEAGSAFAPVYNLPDRLVDQVIAANPHLAERGADLTKLYALKPGDPYVLPERIAKQLNDTPHVPTEALARISAKVTGGWKQWVLLNPLRAITYNLNNVSGDVDVALAADPRIAAPARMVRAAKDLYDFHKGKASPAVRAELERAAALGVIGSGEALSEIPDISRSGMFRQLAGKRRNPLQWYWAKVKGGTTLRENVTRLSAYRRALELAEAGRAPVWASRRGEVDAITDPHERAAKVSRELIGDYGNVSKGGQLIRSRYYPFWSWVEVNAPRYFRLFKNQWQEGRKARGVATAALGVGGLGIRAAALYALVHAFNAIFHPGQDDGMEDGKLKLLLGTDSGGNTYGVRFQGAFSDALGWVGADKLPGQLAKMGRGESDWGDVGVDAAKAPVNKLAQGAVPFQRLGLEVATGKSLFPDVFNPRPIRDRAEHAAGVLSGDSVYRAAAGIPQTNPLARTLVYSFNTGERSYQKARRAVGDWLEESGDERPSVEPTDRANALYYWKRAQALGKADLAEQWKAKYLAMGGTEEGAETSIDKAHPLAAIRADKRAGFLATLSAEQRADVERAERWYFETYHAADPDAAARRYKADADRQGLGNRANAVRDATEQLAGRNPDVDRARLRETVTEQKLTPRERERLGRLRAAEAKVAAIKKAIRLGKVPRASGEREIARLEARAGA